MKAGDIELAKLAKARGWISQDILQRALAEADRCQALGLEKGLDEVLVERGSITAEQLRSLRDALGLSLREPRVGDYEIVRRVGVGGMGTVFEAVHVRLRQRIALKVLQPRLARDPGSIERFLREARVLARLNHPHLVHAIDAGQDGEHYFLAMEFIEGENLLQLLLRTGPLPPLRSCEIVRDVCSALELLESRGLVHRDVKPANILLGQDGVVKLADLGLLTAVESAPGQTICGTPHYMPPERLRPEGELDVRGDIYSLAATWYHLLVGRPPFQGKTTRDVAQGHLERDPAPPSAARPEIPVAVDRVVLRWLAKDRSRRPRSAGEARAEVEQLIGLLRRRPARWAQPWLRWCAAAVAVVALSAAAAVWQRARARPGIDGPAPAAVQAPGPVPPPVSAAPQPAPPVAPPVVPAPRATSEKLAGPGAGAREPPAAATAPEPGGKALEAWAAHARSRLAGGAVRARAGWRRAQEALRPHRVRFEPLLPLAGSFRASFVALSPDEGFEVALRHDFDTPVELGDFRLAAGAWTVSGGALEAAGPVEGDFLATLAWFEPPLTVTVELESDAEIAIGHGSLRLAPGRGSDARIWREGATSTPILAAPVAPSGRHALRFLGHRVEWDGPGFSGGVDAPPAEPALPEPGAGRVLLKLAARKRIASMAIAGRLSGVWARERLRLIGPGKQ